MSKQPTQRRRVHEVVRGWFGHHSDKPSAPATAQSKAGQGTHNAYINDILSNLLPRPSRSTSPSTKKTRSWASSGVSRVEVQRRRAANKRARAARRVHRQRAGR